RVRALDISNFGGMAFRISAIAIFDDGHRPSQPGGNRKISGGSPCIHPRRSHAGVGRAPLKIPKTGFRAYGRTRKSLIPQWDLDRTSHDGKTGFKSRTPAPAAWSS